MEFELDGDVDVKPVGKLEIVLPDYIVMLSQQELNAVQLLDEERIIAAGRCDDTSIVIVTSSGDILKYDSFNTGDVEPIREGLYVRIGTHLDSLTWIFEHAQPLTT